MNTGFVYDITCPNCGKNFSVNADEYKSITEQLTAQIEEHIREEAKAEKEAAVKAAVNSAISAAKIQYTTLEKKVAQEKANDELRLAELNHKLEMAEEEKKAAVQSALTEKEAENIRLSAEIKHLKVAAELSKEAEAQKAENQIQDMEARHQQEKAQYAAESANAIAEKNRLIASLQEKIKSAETEKQLAVKTAKDEMSEDLHAKESEIILLHSQIKAQEQEAQNQAITLKNNYEAALRLKDDEIERIKDFKTRMSTKALGESLELYCQNQFNAIRTTAFPDAYFEKDNDASSGSKGDYIFRDQVDGIDILSIMFEMKTEADQTATKHKNEDFFMKLDKDRNEKKCEYAVLVSTLEPDNEFYNAGIQDVSYRYPKMFVVRPQQFITIISLLRNAALNAVECQKELAMIKSQQLDLTHFEENMNAFKDAFGRNYRIASERLNDAVAGIDRTINSLQKIRENLLSSDNNLRLANDKAEKLNIKQLTKRAPSVAVMLEAAKVSKPENSPLDTADEGQKETA